MSAVRAAGSLGTRAWALPFPLLLAARYLRSGRRDAFVTLLAALAVGGIAIGTSALVVVLAALSGLQSFLRDDVLTRTPQIEITLPSGWDPAAAETLMQRLRAVAGVRSLSRVLRGRGWVRVGSGVRAGEMVGYEGSLPAFFPAPEPARGPGGEPPPAAGLWVGSAPAAAWGLEAGEPVELISPRPALSPFGPVPSAVRIPFAGTYRTGRTEQPDELRLALPLAAAVRLFGSQGMRLSVETAGLSEALMVADRLLPMLPAGAHLATWRELNRPLFFALRLEKSVMFVSVFLIVPVAAMALVTALTLLVAAKRGEIGMLRAMGATAGDMRRGFAYLGLAIGAAGVLAGMGLGATAALVLDRWRLVSAPGNVYFVDHLPFRLEIGDLLIVALSTGGMTLLATLVAARRAAAFEPVEALRA